MVVRLRKDRKQGGCEAVRKKCESEISANQYAVP